MFRCYCRKPNAEYFCTIIHEIRLSHLQIPSDILHLERTIAGMYWILVLMHPTNFLDTRHRTGNTKVSITRRGYISSIAARCTLIIRIMSLLFTMTVSSGVIVG
jgi:hypothetical protein